VSELADATWLAGEHRAGHRSVQATVEDCLEAIAALDPELSALAAVHADAARARAAVLDASLEHGFDPGPLCGVPLVLKGNLCLSGHEASCGSRVLEGYRPLITATVVERLIAAGAVPVATAHMDEFAMGSSGENCAHATTRNPWDLARAPGGSSSGCAAAVAAGLVPLALGSDTGGSVRQPAAFCGVSGFKPTYGRLSRFGLVAFGSSLDQIGPLARSARDLELVLAVASGQDERDPSSLPEPPALPAVESGLRGARVGVPAEVLGPGLDPRVRAVVEGALAHLESLGAERVELSLPLSELAIPCYYVLATAEAASNLGRFDGVRYGMRRPGDGTLAGMQAATRAAGFGAEVKRRILLGTFVLSRGYYEAWYGRATRVRAALVQEFRTAFESVDLIVGPTTPTPAFRLGERSADPLSMYLSDVLTVPASLAGLPAVSIPAGHVEVDGSTLPVGLQIVGPHGADAEVLAAARGFQEGTDHHLRRPAHSLQPFADAPSDA